MTSPLKCEHCGGTSFNMLASKMEGLNKVIDIFLCRQCKMSKIVMTPKLDEPSIQDAPTNIDAYGDVDKDDGDYEILEPENPYEDDDGGWDPSIG